MSNLTLLIKPVSGACNMACKYCFYTDVMANRKTAEYGKMNNETLEILVKKAFEDADNFVSFTFQGGEPTLAGLDFYEHLIVLQKRYNRNHIQVYNAIQTNGYALDERWIDFFKKENFLVGLSMDGTRAIHDSLRVDRQGRGTFGRVERAARKMAETGIQYNILCVVNNFVARHPRQVFEQLKKYRYLQFIPCIDPFDGKREKYALSTERYTGFLKETFEQYYHCIMKNDYVSVRNFDNYIRILLGQPPENCGMSGRCAQYFLVEGDGSVYPCDFYVLDQWKMGNIHTDTFDELRSCTTVQRFIEESRHVQEECRTCQWYSLCRGGCKRDREPVVDGIPGKNRYCESYQEFFQYAYPKMRQIAKWIR